MARKKYKTNKQELIKSQQEIHEFLANQARANKSGTVLLPAEYAKYSPEELYKSLKIAGVDDFGSSSIVYGAFGRMKGVYVGVDFTPNTPVSLNLTLEGKYTSVGSSMLILQEFVPRGNNSSWKTTTPLCLTDYEGRHRTGEISLSFDANFQLLNSVSESLANFPVDLKIGGVNAKVQGKRVKATWRATLPQVYSDYTDAFLSTDLNNYLGVGKKETIKSDIIDWLWSIKLELKKAKIKLDTKKLQDEFDGLWKLLDSSKLPHRKGIYKRWPPMHFTNTSTDEFDQFLVDIMNYLSDPLPYLLDENLRFTIHKQFMWYRDRLNKAKENEIIPQRIITGVKIPPLFDRNAHYYIRTLSEYKKLSFAEIAFNGLGAGASLEFKVLKPEISGPIPGLGLPKTWNDIGEEGTGVETINGDITSGHVATDIRWATSRYQTIGLSEQERVPLVLTQDTKIRYSQFSVKAKGPLYDAISTRFEKIPQLPFFINKISYKSTTIYWNFEDNNSAIKHRPGNGISIGKTIKAKTLQEIASIISAPNYNDLDKYKDACIDSTPYFTQLKISFPNWNLFCKDITRKINIDKPAWEIILKKYKYIILEASFRVKDPNIGQIKDGVVPDLLKKYEFIHKRKQLAVPESGENRNVEVALEAIRVRVRSADHIDNSGKVFKLGLFPFTGAAVGFSTQRIKYAGNQGIWDFTYCSFDQEEIANPVPPVTLLPHTFILT